MLRVVLDLSHISVEFFLCQRYFPSNFSLPDLSIVFLPIVEVLLFFKITLQHELQIKIFIW